MTNQEHDWQVPPTEWRYNGSPLLEFEDDAMRLAHERVRVRFGGDLPRDVSLALNEAFRRGMTTERERIAEDLERIAGDRSPGLSVDENRWHSRAYTVAADRVRYPEKYSGIANGESPNTQAPETTTPTKEK